MTAEVWQGDPPLWYLFERIDWTSSDRKQRLFACACCYRVEHHLTDVRSRQALAEGERYADDPSFVEGLQWHNTQASNAATELVTSLTDGDGLTWSNAQTSAARAVACATAADLSVRVHTHGDNPTALFASAAYYTMNAVANDAHEKQVDPAEPSFQAEMLTPGRLVFDLFGDKFRPVPFDPSWLTPTVAALAAAIYADRASDRMPVLADALEEAGCADARVLDHCRAYPVHARGCWVVDAVLGKS